jgi:hypothetical protein
MISFPAWLIPDRITVKIAKQALSFYSLVNQHKNLLLSKPDLYTDILYPADYLPRWLKG